MNRKRISLSTHGGLMGKGNLASEKQPWKITTPSDSTILDSCMEVINGTIEDLLEKLQSARTEAKRAKTFTPSLIGYIDELVRLVHLKFALKSQVPHHDSPRPQPFNNYKEFMDACPEARDMISKFIRLYWDWARGEEEKSNPQDDG